MPPTPPTSAARTAPPPNVAADVLERQPFTCGRNQIHRSQVAGWIRSSAAMPEVRRRAECFSDGLMDLVEYGVALLRGVSLSERAQRLINIAHPEHRDQLRFGAREAGLLR